MSTSGLPTPNAAQLAWHDMELGMFFHFDLYTYAPEWNFRTFSNHPSPELFNPAKLDTDQWMEAAKAMGAKYAVLTAKHCSGFLMWPSTAYDYGVKQTKWRGGRGDVVGDFVASCRRHGIKPGLYCSVSANGWLKADNPGLVKSGDAKEQARYKAICEQMLRELWSNYGELTEIWFDGSSLAPEKGGPDFIPMLRELQPNAVVFQSPAASIRWVGNEDGVAPYPCWSTVADLDKAGGGDPDGKLWCPGECDVPIRKTQWFWKPGEENRVKDTDHLVGLYYKSVGRNCNLLLNANINRDGLVPEPDMTRYAEFEREIRRRFAKPIAETKGEGETVTLSLGKPTRLDHVVTMEDIRHGERVRKYVVEAEVGGHWREICGGSCIGHKRVDAVSPITAPAIRLRCVESVAMPKIRSLAVYFGGER